MGWTGSQGTLNQLPFKFDTLDQAKAYADKRGIDYEVELLHERKLANRAYADNFAYTRLR